MKEKYKKPFCTIDYFSSVNVITTSVQEYDDSHPGDNDVPFGT